MSKHSWNASPRCILTSRLAVQRRHAALKRLQRICEREVDLLRSQHTLATAKFYLSSYRNALRAIDPNHPALSARRHRSHQRFSYLALTPEETRAINAAYQKEIHKDQSALIPLDAETFIATLHRHRH